MSKWLDVKGEGADDCALLDCVYRTGLTTRLRPPCGKLCLISVLCCSLQLKKISEASHDVPEARFESAWYTVLSEVC